MRVYILGPGRVLSQGRYVHLVVCLNQDRASRGQLKGTKFIYNICLTFKHFGIEYRQNQFLNKRVKDEKPL